MTSALKTLRESRPDLRASLTGTAPVIPGQWVEITEVIEGKVCALWRDRGAVCGDGYAMLDARTRGDLERVLVDDDIEVKLVYPRAGVYRHASPETPLLTDLVIAGERRPRRELVAAALEAGLAVEPLLYEGETGVPWDRALDLLCVRGALEATSPRRAVLYWLSWRGRQVHAALLERPEEKVVMHARRKPQPIVPAALEQAAGDRDRVRAVAASIVAADRLERARAEGRTVGSRKPRPERGDGLLLPFLR